MRVYYTICLAAVMAAPQLKPAETAKSPRELGHVEAAVDFCSRVDSESADKYKEWGKRMVRDMSEKALADARKSSEYKETYDEFKSGFETIPAEMVAEGCRAGLKAEKK